MEADKIIAELKRYENAIEEIKSRFSKNRDSIHIKSEDDPLLRQYVHELNDLYNDLNIKNNYSGQIIAEFSEGLSNYVRSPSYKSVENILVIIRASITRFKRNPKLLNLKESETKSLSQIQRENIFIIHGRDEAKWRELKDTLETEFRLIPIILEEKPDVGCNTVIEKFEYYAQSCSYAIAIFTPEDEVTFQDETYLQARPNVIYEIGWFCGKLGRSRVMLLLKEGTSIFSNFNGIIQKKFSKSINEKLLEIKRDLVNSGIINQE
jgi:predicted nucleotide-binding protein